MKLGDQLFCLLVCLAQGLCALEVPAAVDEMLARNRLKQ
jgi:hypothetical protein